MYNQLSFIDSDPIQVPHQFDKKEDIEISGFLTATISWGNRKSIINNALRLVTLMDHAPYEFIMHHEEKDLKRFESFVHRTFNSTDLIQFIKSLKHIYSAYNGLEAVFSSHAESDSLQLAIHEFKKIFFEIPHLDRTKKHVSDPLKNSAAKRINIFIRVINTAKLLKVYQFIFSQSYMHILIIRKLIKEFIELGIC